MDIQPPSEESTSIFRAVLDLASIPEMHIAFWAGLGGAMRALALRAPLLESTICVFMAIVWGVVLSPFAEPLFYFILSFFTKVSSSPASLDAIQRAVVVVVGILGIAITGFVMNFFSAWVSIRTKRVGEKDNDKNV